MIDFLRKIWGLVWPYRMRLFLGVLMGIISGLVGPLMISTAMFVYAAVFPTANGGDVLPLKHMPNFLQTGSIMRAMAWPVDFTRIPPQSGA